MAFTPDEIEDGTGKSTALVYSTTGDPVAECLAYLTREGRPAFYALGAATINGVPAREIHVLRAVRYVEERARRRIKGLPTVRGQALLMPRRNVEVIDEGYTWSVDDGQVYIASNEIPKHWLRAVWEAAELSAAGEPLSHVVDDEAQVKRKQTGRSLETEWFAEHTKEKTYNIVDDLLRPFLHEIGRLERG